MKQLIFFLYSLLFFTACSQTDTQIESPSQILYTTEQVVPDLVNPWGMAFLPDGSILISEKSGILIHFENGQRNRVQGLPEITVLGQGGLLDLELHPDYNENGWIYLSYVSAEGDGEGGNTAIMRARLKDNQLIDQELIYKATPNTNSGAHFGSRIEFDSDHYLYFSIGDRYNRDVNPQDITKDGGKIYRLKDNGEIPSDNPFVNDVGAKKAIYSYGHRNPQGMAIHPKNGKIWIHEHGPKGGDEINEIDPGKNYGWPVITYGLNYSGTQISNDTAKEGMEQPIHYWVPSIAPCGMTFVTSDKYPEWKGDLLVGSLKFGYLERLILEDNKVIRREMLLEDIGRLRNVRQASDGFIYIAVEGSGILKLIPQKQ